MKHLPVLCSLLIGSAASSFAHSHFAAGFVDANGNNHPDPGEALRFVTPLPPSSTYHMTWVPREFNYGGYYSLNEFPRDEYPEDYFTFTALSDGQTLAAEPGHAATGSYIWLEITSVVGPAGGEFGFWEAGDSYVSYTPTVSFLANEPTDGFKFVLSEPYVPGAPNEDPYGHIHDRGWTVTLPGDYYVTFTLYDMSTNGPEGGPIHTPSVPYTLHFVAIPEPGTWTFLGLAGVGCAAWAWRRRIPR